MSREGNPSAESEAGLAGDLGISSERTGPFAGVEGTGTVGSARARTDGDTPTHPDDAAAAHEDDPARTAEGNGGVDGVVPDDAASHPFDPARHPGHSHG